METVDKIITNAKELMELIDDYGFLPFFRNAVSGFSIEEHISPRLWFAEDTDGPWEWKGPVIQQSGCAYGKFFGGKAGFISAEWYPDFANYRRDGYDFDARYEDGLAAYQDKTVYDIIEQYDSLLSKEMKRLGGFGKNGRKGFDSIMTRLQMQGYITTIDFEYQKDKRGKTYGWGVARYATPERHFGDAFTKNVYSRTPAESKEKILQHLSAKLPMAEEAQLVKIMK